MKSMKQYIRSTIVASLLVAALASTTTSVRAEDLKEKSTDAIENFKQADPGLTNFFSKCAGYAIFPSVGEAGFIFAGEKGDGLVYEKDKLTGRVKLTEYSIGAQAGDTKFSEIIFFETEAALKAFKQAKWGMAAGVKATMAASGAAAGAKYQQGVAVFTLPKSGAMVAAAIGGQKFEFTAIK